MSSNGVHVVFIIDILIKPRFDNATLLQCLNSILAFGNSFLMQSGNNKLTILGSSPIKNSILYVDDEINSKTENSNDDSKKDTKIDFDYVDCEINITDQQNEQFAMITETFRRNFSKWIEDCRERYGKLLLNNTSTENRANPENPNNINTNSQLHSLLAGSLAQALCLIHSYQNYNESARIIVFSLGADPTDTYSSQYMKLINCFFAAQKINVLIDACAINLRRESEESSPLSASLEDQFASSVLQQGCDLTGGRFIRIHKVGSILEHLFWCLTPSANERPQYVLPPKHQITPPAACCCHRKILDLGFVCSVCLSIYCQFSPFCSTCNSNLFKSNLNQIAKLNGMKSADYESIME
ncbi:General transcription factor IIH subunit 3 [Sarcoptes scabiei]|uniref:General transcription factor IIH subunit 3 n=1 Tax=Sarcoptes scabiei TaxID=52283 RepID=A0A834R8R7_SARSC|nr:General transcription factor IIH subunit 3 [Sarcoptes scabiei]UXI20594.1 Dynamin-1-like protein [Sarcoptes scabiei]